MSTAITFDGNNLQTSVYTTSDIDGHDGLPQKNANAYALAHANKSVLPFVNYPARQITIKGNIKGTSISDAESKIDTFKSYFNKKEGNLDIGFAGGTRRFIATVIGLQVDRPQGLTTADYTIVFNCTYPFGTNTSVSSLLTASANTVSPTNFAPTFQGNCPYQLPVITLTYVGATSSAANSVTNPGFEVDLSGWSSGGIGTATRVTAQHNTGVAAMQMVNAASSPLSVPSANTYGWELYALSGLVPGTTYTVQMWVKGNAGGETFKTQSLLSAVTTQVLTTGWQLVSFTFVASFTTDQIYVWSTTASATWFLDDVSVIPFVPVFLNVTNHANGQGILLFTNILAPGDVIVMDSSTRKVTQNGVEIDFTGSFIEIANGVAQIDYVDGLLTRNFTINISQTALFL